MLRWRDVTGNRIERPAQLFRGIQVRKLVKTKNSNTTEYLGQALLLSKYCVANTLLSAL